MREKSVVAWVLLQQMEVIASKGGGFLSRGNKSIRIKKKGGFGTISIVRDFPSDGRMMMDFSLSLSRTQS